MHSTAASAGLREGVTIPELIFNRASQDSGSPAVIESEETLSYGELLSRSTQMSNYLRHMGVKPGDLIAICLDRSLDFVICALSIWHSGAAYLPLDPHAPLNRLTNAIQDSGASFVISHSDYARNLPQHGPAPVILLDHRRTMIEQQNSDFCPAALSPEYLAYVIYTSGSTGRPKGVEITHANLENLVLWHRERFAILPSDRGVFSSNPGFDAAVWELWPYLAFGASILIADEVTRRSPELMQAWLIKKGITIAFVPTPMAEAMLTLKWPSEIQLRTLLTGADTLHIHPPAGLPFELINNYGPTECTVVSTSGLVPPGHSMSRPSIGKPIRNTTIYILDENRNRVPAGVAGEIYIGGVSVGRGYRNNVPLTAERFLKDPFSSDSAARMYRTGDQGMELPNGEITILGRIDDQVKIRGYRIELSEVADMLTHHPQVRAAVVTPEMQRTSDLRLIAYFVPAGAQCPTPAEMRDYLAAHLPEYMLPAAFVRLDHFPVTEHGKIDRSRLPAPGPSDFPREGLSAAAGGAIEMQIAEILASLLGLPTVGLDENFFLLGGHSLLGTQLIARLRSTYGVDLTLRVLFAKPTARALAREIEMRLSTAREAV